MPVRLIAEGVWRVYAWAEPGGSCQVLEFLARLRATDRREHDVIQRRVSRLTRFGAEFRDEKQCRYLRDGIFELKTHRGAVRLYFFFERDHIVICTHSGHKPKGEAAVRKEIDRALRIKRTRNDELE